MTCLYGLAAGVAAVVFNLSIEFFHELTFGTISESSFPRIMIFSFIIIHLTSLLSGYLLTRGGKEAAGSGIPQLKLAFWKDFGYMPWRVVWIKYLAGLLSVGGGASLGREGPSVQLAGGLASNLAGKLGVVKQKRRPAAVAGAAAGLAAAFNTPLAAMTFVLEEIIEDMNSRFLGSVLLASFIGALVVFAFIGENPAFEIPEMAAPSFYAHLLTPVVAGLSALIGVGFQIGALNLRKKNKDLQGIPDWARPCCGAFITWILGVTIYGTTGHMGVFGLGYEDLSQALHGNLGWKIAGLLLFGKMMATVSCYGFGACGGIFAPTLFLGAVSGVFVSGLCGELGLQLTSEDSVVLAVVGMSACMGAVVRAPITAILIVFEMTHQFTLVPALMLGTLVSQAVAISLMKNSFYESILLQDGHRLKNVIPPRDLRSWQQLPVSVITNYQPATIKTEEYSDLNIPLSEHPYQRFPVLEAGKLIGILTRKAAETSLKSGESPYLEPAKYCQRNQTIKNIQHLLIESTTGIVVVVDEGAENILGIITLHDLLRAQVALASKHPD